MALVYILLLEFLAVYNLKFAQREQLFDDCMSKRQTASINALFVITVFFSHLRGYYNCATSDYTIFGVNIFKQLMVVSFLFYSGYGLMESIKSGGGQYIKNLPKNRFLKVFLQMSVAVLLFLVLGLCRGETFSFKQIVLSFLCWDDLGNSNWFIFVTLVFYIFIYVSFIFYNEKRLWISMSMTIILSIGYVFVIKEYKTGVQWFNTFLCLPAGMVFSIFKDKFFELMKKSKLLWYYLSFFVIVALFFVVYFKVKLDAWGHNLLSILFSMLLVFITMKIKIENKVLIWIGKHTFWIYILQRIPMIIFKDLGLASYSKYLFMIVCLASTLLISWLMQSLFDKVAKIIKIKKEEKTKLQSLEK